MKKVALVLSAGGARGLAEAGAIWELEKQGFKINSIAGTSMGSVIGGLYAMGQLQDYINWIKNLQKRDIFMLMDFTLSKKGLIKGERVFKYMQNFIPDINIEDMLIPFAAVATDLLAQKPVVFTKGSFYKAIRASTAIPNVLIPVQYKDSILVDGGLLNPLPLEQVHREYGDILVVVNLYSGKALKNNPVEKEKPKQNHKINIDNKYLEQFSQNFKALYKQISEYIPKADKHSAGHLELLDLSTSAMLHRIANLQLQLHKPNIVINIPINLAETFDFHQADYLVEYGRKATAQAIKNYKAKLINT